MEDETNAASDNTRVKCCNIVRRRKIWGEGSLRARKMANDKDEGTEKEVQREKACFSLRFLAIVCFLYKRRIGRALIMYTYIYKVGFTSQCK